MKYPTRTLISASMACAFFLAGCATTPAPIPQIESARSAVAAARADPAISRNSPQELERATRLLDSAATAAKTSKGRDAAAHYGYLAGQTAKLATQRSRAAEAEAKVASAQGERDRILLQAREAETQRARQSASAAQAEASAAQAENERLSRELADLQAQPTDRGIVLTLGGDVLFATGRADLKSGSQRMLEQVQRFLEQNPERRVRVEGFTDSTGSEELNLELSRRRAEAVARELVSRGVDSSRIQTSGLGESYPVADNNVPGGRQLNRRVEIIIGNGSAEVAGR